jgi:hypothetical protein
MTREEAKHLVKEAMLSGDISNVKEALNIYKQVRYTLDQEANQLFLTAQNIFGQNI